MDIEVDVAIIGAGSAGLLALRQVKKRTDSYVVIDEGPLGTTCARVGCMPSKALIHAAREYHARQRFEEQGIKGADGVSCDLPAVLRHVRKLRDHFTRGMVEATRRVAGDALLEGRAQCVGPNTIRAGDTVVHAGRIVVAAGAKPFVPGEWRRFDDRILTSENVFEQEDMPGRLGVIGLGPIGLELGQAFSRLGVEVTGFSLDQQIGGLSDPDVNAAALAAVKADFNVHLGRPAEVEDRGAHLVVRSGADKVNVDKILVAMGVKPDIAGLGLEHLDVPLDDRGLASSDIGTTQVGDLPVYLAGDVDGCRPVLHEALDEGVMAGRNATGDDASCFCRRVRLRIVFTDPGLAVVGRSWQEVQAHDTVTGTADFQDQSRAELEGRNQGLLHLYADRGEGRLLGAELAVPEAEHLGHTLALAIQGGMTVFDMLRMPFYHPTMEEGLRTALRDAAEKLPAKLRAPDMPSCESCPEKPLC